MRALSLASFRPWTGRADDPRAEEFSQHQRRRADAGRRRRHQQRFALEEVRASEEPVMHDDEHHRHRCRLFPCQRRRRRHHLARVDQREFGKTTGAAGHHPVAFLDPGDPGADLNDLARRVAAAGALVGGLARRRPHAVQPAKLGAVDRRRADPHQHLPRPDHRALNVAHIPSATIGARHHDRRLHRDFLRRSRIAVL